MIGDFTFCNPTRLYFRKNSLEHLHDELPKYGKTVLLVYGSGSIKKNGIYDQVKNILQTHGKYVIENGGIMPNPTIEKVYEGCQIARKYNVDLILAVGGGSCCDYAKAVSVSAWCEEDPWQKYYVDFRDVDTNTKIIPVGCILTMAGTGSEMNGGAVITNHRQKMKVGHIFGDNVFPKFSILNPVFTYTLPRYQMISGIYDVFSHICEQYFSGEDDCTSDYISEGLMRSVICSSRVAIKTPLDYEARSNLMWNASWALNTLIAKGKSTDWMVHKIGQAISVFTDATHGMTLAAVSTAYYRHICSFGLPKFVRFAKNVWDVETKDKTDTEIADEGLALMRSWMNELGLIMNITDLGVKPEMIPDIADSTILLSGGYKILTKKDVIDILWESL